MSAGCRSDRRVAVQGTSGSRGRRRPGEQRPEREPIGELPHLARPGRPCRSWTPCSARARRPPARHDVPGPASLTSCAAMSTSAIVIAAPGAAGREVGVLERTGRPGAVIGRPSAVTAASRASRPWPSRRRRRPSSRPRTSTSRGVAALIFPDWPQTAPWTTDDPGRPLPEPAEDGSPVAVGRVYVEGGGAADGPEPPPGATGGRNARR